MKVEKRAGHTPPHHVEPKKELSPQELKTQRVSVKALLQEIWSKVHSLVGRIVNWLRGAKTRASQLFEKIFYPEKKRNELIAFFENNHRALREESSLAAWLAGADLMKTWQAEYQKFLKAQDKAQFHPRGFEIDAGRSPLVWNYDADKFHKFYPKEEISKEIDKQLIGLLDLCPAEEFHLLRSQIEFLFTQEILKRGFIRSKILQELYDKEALPFTDIRPQIYRLFMKDDTVLFRATHFERITDDNPENSLGYNAYRFTAVIHLDKARAPDWFLSEGCAEVTCEYHGFRKTIEEIAWSKDDEPFTASQYFKKQTE